MALALPRNIQLKLEQTLAQWPQWHCVPALNRQPEVIRVLTPGVSNFSVLVESGERFVVRIDGLNPAINGLSRQTEWCTLEAAHAAALAPAPRYFNPDLGSLVCDYLPSDTAQEENPAAIGRLLRAIHQLPARHHRLDLAERILRYEKQLEHRRRASSDELRQCRGTVLRLLQALSQQPVDAVLCHNDLLRANRITSGGKVWALDWEYCAMGNPWYDIAVVVNGDSLSAAQVDALLNAYLDRSPNDEERDTLQRFGCIYRYLELLWYLALDRPVLGEDVMREKSAMLLEMAGRSG